MSNRKLTFKQLKSVKGWPFGRQHTAKLVRDGKIPAPEKAYPDAPSSALNVWDERTWDAFQSTATKKQG
jgi:hypothetical protein